jgi:hypothetical protein
VKFYNENAVIPKQATEVTRVDAHGIVDLHVTNLGESSIVLSFKRVSDFRNVLSNLDIKIMGHRYGDKLVGPIAPGSITVQTSQTDAHDRALDTRLFLKRRAYGHSRDSQIGSVNYLSSDLTLHKDVSDRKVIFKSVKCNFHRMNNESFNIRIGNRDHQEIELFDEKSLFEVAETINMQLQNAESFVNSHGIDFSSDESIELFNVPRIVTKKLGIVDKKVNNSGLSMNYIKTRLIKPRSRLRYVLFCKSNDQISVYAISDKGNSKVRVERSK